MKSILTTIFISILTGYFCNAQFPVTATLPISDSLKKNAHSVKREETVVFDIKAVDKAYLRVHDLVTVLDESAKDQLYFQMYTDKFRLLEDISIVLYNEKGIQIKKYSKKDLVSFNAGEGLVSDGKVYLLDIPNSVYPVHVQMDYEIKYNGLLHYPSYEVQSINQSVEKSSFTVIVPADLDIRYKEQNIKLAPVITTDKDKKIYAWSAQNMKALRYEAESVSQESYCPEILIAPNRFELDGYGGDMTSWEKFGEWYGSLSKNAKDLSPERKLFFQSLVKNAANDKEKAAIIYKYLQQNCRYVLITLGIGGFKPFEASFVDKKKYGDCKALSNYTQACLDAVGIKSYQALINAAYNKAAVDPNFPSNNFNHVILFVPLGSDSVWLECTSNTNEFGVLGSFTENRNALLITENGGKLVATPKSIAGNNILRTYCNVLLREDGSGTAKIKLQTKGEYKNPFLLTEKKDEQKSYLVNQFGFLQPDDFLLTEKDPENSEYWIDMELDKIPAFAAGNKQFLSPRIYKIWQANLPGSSLRTQDYFFRCPFIKYDTTVYKLPEGYTMEALPETKELSFEYGKFVAKYNYDKAKNELMTFARLELTNYRIPAAGYDKAKTFFDNVLAEYNSKIVIRKGE